MNPLLTHALVAVEDSADLQRAAACCSAMRAHRRTAHATTRRANLNVLRRAAAVQPVSCGCA